MRERFVRQGFTLTDAAVMDVNPKSAWTIGTLALAGAVLLSGTLPWSGRNAGLDGAAFAARAPGSQSRQGRAPKPAEADHPPVAPEGKAEAETWSDAEIIAGLEECVRLLAPTGAEVEISKPIRNGQCGTPAPVLLKRIAGVEVTPPAVVNCRLAAKLDHWMKDTVQPVAEEMLGGRVTRIITASAYACRQRIGTTGGRLSEHSLANALDISAFLLSSDLPIDVLTNGARRRVTGKRRRKAKIRPGEGMRGRCGMQSRSTGHQPARRGSCGACMKAPAPCSVQCWGPRRMRRTAITCTWTWRPVSIVRSASKQRSAAQLD